MDRLRLSELCGYLFSSFSGIFLATILFEERFRLFKIFFFFIFNGISDRITFFLIQKQTILFEQELLKTSRLWFQVHTHSVFINFILLYNKIKL